jgi:hypothetical protein
MDEKWDDSAKQSSINHMMRLADHSISLCHVSRPIVEGFKYGSLLDCGFGRTFRLMEKAPMASMQVILMSECAVGSELHDGAAEQ